MCSALKLDKQDVIGCVYITRICAEMVMSYYGPPEQRESLQTSEMPAIAPALN